MNPNTSFSFASDTISSLQTTLPSLTLLRLRDNQPLETLSTNLFQFKSSCKFPLFKETEAILFILYPLSSCLRLVYFANIISNFLHARTRYYRELNVDFFDQYKSLRLLVEVFLVVFSLGRRIRPSRAS